MDRMYEDIKKGEKGAWISIAAYLCLAALKLSIGYWTNSEALSADGLNNSTDIIASLAVLIGLRISRKPPDRDHRYGHFRAETVSALVASFIMFAVGLQVLYQAAASFGAQHETSQGSVAAWTALFSAAAIYMVYRYNARLAKQINSQAMMAAAQDNRSDALVSVGAFIGIFAAQWGLPWLDPLTALIVGVIICRTASGHLPRCHACVDRRFQRRRAAGDEANDSRSARRQENHRHQSPHSRQQQARRRYDRRKRHAQRLGEP